MDVVQKVADGNTVVARRCCSGTHLGVWRGHAPTVRHFERIDEVYFFSFLNGKVSGGWGIDDNSPPARPIAPVSVLYSFGYETSH
ncbi:ester cyclase [Pseudarthrobacter sp. NPDC089323]